MEKFISKICWAVVALATTLTLASCNPEPKATDVEFSYPTFECEEGEENAYISVYLMQSPYKFPVVVDMNVEMVENKGVDANGNRLKLDDVIDFITTDKSYTVTPTGDYSATISGLEVTYSGYNQRVYFNAKKVPLLQQETIEIRFTLTRVEGSEMGNVTETILTIIDAENAPLVRVGYYDTTYSAPAEGTREGRGQFYMRVQKVDKYKYVASELFGLSRPRLLGLYEPSTNTIVFDGTDYDHRRWFAKEGEEVNRVNAFENDTPWTYSREGDVVKQILKFYGGGASGKEPIVIKTDKIEENASGYLVEIVGECGFQIWNYDEAQKAATTFAGTWDGLDGLTKMTHSQTDYEVSTQSRSVGTDYPTPFSQWTIGTIND
jgi:hypothetical protein